MKRLFIFMFLVWLCYIGLSEMLMVILLMLYSLIGNFIVMCCFFSSFFNYNFLYIFYVTVLNFISVLFLVIIFCFLFFHIISFFNMKVQYPVVDFLSCVEYVQFVIFMFFILFFLKNNFFFD